MSVYDREYMRDEPDFRLGRPNPWSPTIMLLVTLGVIFLGQLALPFQTSKEVDRYFALSLDGILHGYVWQLLTFQFLHAGFWHILFNGIGLYFLGRFMEETIGVRRFLTLYFLSGTAGGLLQILAAFIPGHKDMAVVGASAGVMGLMGAFATMYPHRRITVLIVVFPVTLQARLLFWILTSMAVIGTIVPFGGVAHAAHLGGILAGLAFIRFGEWQAARSETSRDSTLPPFLQKAPPPDAAEDAAEFITREVDPILDKIAAHGIHSLTDRERKVLESARARIGKR